jgi:hypothetical protein
MQAREVLLKIRGALSAVPISLEFPNTPPAGSWQEAASKFGLVGLFDYLLSDLDKPTAAVSKVEASGLADVLANVLKELGGKAPPKAQAAQSTPTWQTEAAKGITSFVNFLYATVGTDPEADGKKGGTAKESDGSPMTEAGGGRMSGGSQDNEGAPLKDEDKAVIRDKDESVVEVEDANPPGGGGADDGTNKSTAYLDLADESL